MTNKLKFKSEMCTEYFGKNIDIDMVESAQIRDFLNNLYKIGGSKLASHISFVVSGFGVGEDHIDYICKVLRGVKSDILMIQNELRDRVKND